ncbi:MAG: Crp/Fnr family transcriptional regulator [Chitinophagales bacterium]|nr:Crp/Fnr family transcriptional regulator [Chitinophagaceae bacterium]MCB9065712.1 Crp/Fnr family transcriptional regulator [Chitinophagales bacterium]
MTDLQLYIKNFFDVNDELLYEIASRFVPRQVNKGDFLLKQGRQCNQLSFIKSGLVRIYTNIEDKEVTQWISTQGYFVTDLASFTFNTPARWNLQTLTDCELYTIEKDSYNQLIDVVPEWLQLEKLFIAKCFIILEERVNRHLFMTAEERYNQLMEQQPELFNQVPLQYLSSMLGMTPETFSRIRKKQLG